MKSRASAGGWRSLPSLLLLGVAVTVFADGRAPAFAQSAKSAKPAPDSSPVIEGLYPPCARLGETRRLTIVGKGLDRAVRGLISGEGVEVKLIGQPSAVKVEAEATVRPDAAPGFREFRLAGPSGITNLMILRVDHLPHALETEPNDAIGQAQAVERRAAICGILKPLDVDHFKVSAKKDQVLTIDLEARRLASPLTPLITIYEADGRELAQGRETPGTGGDCRMTFAIPEDGDYVIQVRDNIFSGGDSAHYRLRLDDQPSATAVFPLGGPKGQAIEVAADGGGLKAVVKKTVRLPDQSGDRVDPGPFDGPGGPMVLPFELAAGDGPEVFEAEAAAAPTNEPTILPWGGTANGRISRPGEFDRFRIEAKKGRLIRLRVRAAELGSRLDSVLLLRDAKGAIVADNDEPDPNQRPGSGALPADTPRLRDSILDYDPKSDGTFFVEIHDRFSDGGAEFGYRLEQRPAAPELAIVLLLRPIAANQRVQSGGASGQPGANGSLNLKPGSKTPINFQVSGVGFQGKVEVRVEGLPDGVKAAPVTVRLAGRGNNRNAPQLKSAADRIVFDVAKDAKPSLSRIQVIAVAKPEGEASIEQSAIIPLTLDSIKMSTPTRPIIREATSLPLMVLESGKP